MAIPKPHRVELSEQAPTFSEGMVQSEPVTTLFTERVMVGTQILRNVDTEVEDKVHSNGSKFDQRSYNQAKHLKDTYRYFYDTIVYKLRNFRTLTCRRRKEIERSVRCIIYKRTGSRVSFSTVRLLSLVGFSVYGNP
jgi:hypothetical protein